MKRGARSTEKQDGRKLPRKPLWLLLAGILLLIMFSLGAVVLFGISRLYQNRIEAEYVSRGRTVARLAASLTNGEAVDRYLAALEKDAEYDKVTTQLKILQKESGAAFVYISRVVEGGAVFVFDADETAPVPLGGFDEWSASYDVVAPRLLRGERVAPVEMDTKWGWLLVTYEPVLRNDGSVAAYVGVDISMDKLTRERRTAFISTGVILALVLTVSIALFLFAFDRVVMYPIGALVENVSTYMPVSAGQRGGESGGRFNARAYRAFAFSGDNEFRVLGRAVKEMKQRISTALSEQMKAEEITRLMLDSMPLCCQLWDKNCQTIDCNEAGVRLYGLRNKQEYIERFAELSPEYQSDGRRSGEKMRACLEKAFTDGSFGFEWTHQTPDGKPIPAEVMLVRVKYGDDYVVAAYTRDLRSIREMEDDIRSLKTEAGKAYFDALTDINNRRFLDENLPVIIKSLSRSRSVLSVMMLDIDFFKKYNDTYGHLQGDACLKEIAQTIAKCVTRLDDFAVRYGGEEFAVVLPNTNEEGARVVADRLLEKIRARAIPHRASDVSDCVTVSIGVASGKVEYPLSETDFVKSADEALYAAKQSGRARYTVKRI